jgi:hypothetical protein
MRKWMVPWLFPVELLGAVAFVSRPLLGVAWVGSMIGTGRLATGYWEYRQGRTAPGTHRYLKNLSE